MTTIVTRAGKGSPLTHTEVDTNFTNLNTAKLETAAIPLGTLGAPSISFLNYSTTGIYSPAGNELGVSMLGSDKIRIKSTGEIIINATASRTILGVTPRLQVEGSTSSSQCSLSLTGAGAGGSLIPRLYFSKARSSVNAVVLEDDILGTIFFNGGDGSSLVNAGFIKAEVDGTPSAGIVPGRLVFATVDTAGSSGERMIIKNNGNVSIDGTTFNVDAVNNRVGLGTSSPNATFDCRGNATFTGNGTARQTADFTNTGGQLYVGVESSAGGAVFTGSSAYAGIVGTNTSTSLQLASNGAVRATLDSSGRVGIGTTTFAASPSSRLNVKQTSNTRYDGLWIENSANEIGIGIGYDNSSDCIAFSPSYGSTGSYKGLAFYTSNLERGRWDTSGRFLVGTSSSSAAAKLIVQGNTSDGAAGGLAQLQIGSTTPADAAVLGRLDFSDSAGYQGAWIRGERDGGTWTSGSSHPGRLVFSTTPDGSASPTPKMTITNVGYTRIAANAASVLNYGHEFADDTANTITLSVNQRSNSYAQAGGGMLFLNCVRAASSGYTFLGAYSGDVADREFNLRGDGNAFADGTWTGGGADYAEYFEWSDDNPGEEDRRGISVVLNGEKIRPAIDGEDPIGVISGNPSVVGDAAWNKWSGKYLRDDYGTYIQEDYEVVNDEGETIIQQRRKLNPAYDPNQEYTPREQRPEWDCVGLMGKLRIRKGQPTGSRWIKMRDISDSVEEWLVR